MGKLIIIVITFVFTKITYSQWDTLNYKTDSIAVQIILDSCGCPPVKTFEDPYGNIKPVSVANISDSTNGRIHSLFISGFLSLCKPILRKEISYLTELDSLDISRNFLGVLPGELFTLKKLVFLDISGNELAELPHEIGNLRNLKTLKLMLNKLTTLPPEIGCLDSLHYLKLSVNSITEFPKGICNLPSLYFLLFDSNKLDTIPDEIGYLKNLIFLYLWDNAIRYLPPTIGSLQNLDILYLENNRLATIPEEIGNLVNLTRFSIADNQLTMLPLSLINLNKMFVFDPGGNSICDILPDTLEKWLNLHVGGNWRQFQKGCSSIIYKRSEIYPPKKTTSSAIFTLDGRRIHGNLKHSKFNKTFIQTNSKKR